MNNTVPLEQEYAEAIESLMEDIKDAITLSITHDEIVHVNVDGSTLDLTDSYRIIFLLADECDSARENARLEDVWGSKAGEDFRLKFHVV